MKFSKMDRQTAKEIAVIARRALDAAFAGAGIEVQINGGKFDNHTYSPRVTFAVAGGLEDKQREEFELYARVHGLKDSDYGRTFDFRGTKYTLCGLRPRAGKYPVIGADGSGKRMCFMLTTVHKSFGYPAGGYRESLAQGFGGDAANG